VTDDAIVQFRKLTRTRSRLALVSSQIGAVAAAEMRTVRCCPFCMVFVDADG
jgi:hypothetical protein